MAAHLKKSLRTKWDAKSAFRFSRARGPGARNVQGRPSLPGRHVRPERIRALRMNGTTFDIEANSALIRSTTTSMPRSTSHSTRGPVVVAVGSHLIGLPTAAVREMFVLRPTGRPPGLAPEQRGVVTLQTKVLPVLELRMMLGLPTANSSRSTADSPAHAAGPSHSALPPRCARGGRCRPSPQAGGTGPTVRPRPRRTPRSWPRSAG